jgi:hypothetical protein
MWNLLGVAPCVLILPAAAIAALAPAGWPAALATAALLLLQLSALLCFARGDSDRADRDQL